MRVVREPAHQQEMAAAERAAEGHENPMEGLFDSITRADSAKFDRAAMRAVPGK
jgi:hypothetical protein